MTYLREISDDIRATVPSGALPDEPVTELFDVYALLALSLGTEVAAADVHDAWVTWRLRRDDQHSSLVPFEDLPSEVAADDDIFVEAIRTVARRRGLGRRG